MDDYRAGYAAGVKIQQEETNQRRAWDRCDEVMGADYHVAPRYEQFATPEPASSFFSGCWHAVGGVKSDWWNVSGYLTA